MECVHRLVLHLPTGLTALHEIDDAGLVALVGVVVHAEGVAKLIERDLFRVAEPCMKNLESRAVRLEAERRALVGIAVFLPFFGDQRITPIADRSVNASVRAEGESVQVVAGKGDADAEAFLNDLFLVGYAIIVSVAQHVDLRNAGEIERSIVKKDPRSGAIENIVVAVGKDVDLVQGAVPIAVSETADDFALGSHVFHGNLSRPFFMQLPPISGFLRREIVQIPEKVVAVILNAEAETVCLRYVDVALFVEGERRGGFDPLTLEIRLDLERTAFRNRRAGQRRSGGKAGY